MGPPLQHEWPAVKQEGEGAGAEVAKHGADLVVAKHGADLEKKHSPEETAPASSAPLAVGAAAHHGASRPGRRRPPQPRAEIQVRLCRSISRLPVRSGRGGENEAHGATRTVGAGSDGERTAGWRAAAGEIGGLE